MIQADSINNPPFKPAACNQCAPIETHAFGYRFRSRLEARWATFFDALNLEWFYEHEGFYLGDNRTAYLPDFYLPSIETYVEIKGTAPTGIEKAKAGMLSSYTAKRVWVTHGSIPYPYPSYDLGFKENGLMFFGDSHGGLWVDDFPYWFCECEMCGAIGIEFEGRSARIHCGCSHDGHGSGDKCYSANSERIQSAYIAARSSRFEYDARRR